MCDELKWNGVCSHSHELHFIFQLCFGIAGAGYFENAALAAAQPEFFIIH